MIVYRKTFHGLHLLFRCALGCTCRTVQSRGQRCRASHGCPRAWHPHTLLPPAAASAARRTPPLAPLPRLCCPAGSTAAPSCARSSGLRWRPARRRCCTCSCPTATTLTSQTAGAPPPMPSSAPWSVSRAAGGRPGRPGRLLPGSRRRSHVAESRSSPRGLSGWRRPPDRRALDRSSPSGTPSPACPARSAARHLPADCVLWPLPRGAHQAAVHDGRLDGRLQPRPLLRRRRPLVWAAPAAAVDPLRQQPHGVLGRRAAAAGRERRLGVGGPPRRRGACVCVCCIH